MNLAPLLFFIATWFLAVYIGNCLLARKLKRMQLSRALLYMSVMAFLGVIGEVAIDTIYAAVNGRPLWLYEVLPIHGGYTSEYSLAIWAMVGFQMYLLHDTLKTKKITSLPVLAAIFCIEAILLEALVNLSFLASFGQYIYYYLPPDLWHVTSLQVLPLYLVSGFISVFVLKKSLLRPNLFMPSCISLALVFVFIVHG